MSHFIDIHNTVRTCTGEKIHNIPENALLLRSGQFEGLWVLDVDGTLTFHLDTQSVVIGTRLRLIDFVVCDKVNTILTLNEDGSLSRINIKSKLIEAIDMTVIGHARSISNCIFKYNYIYPEFSDQARKFKSVSCIGLNGNVTIITTADTGEIYQICVYHGKDTKQFLSIYVLYHDQVAFLILTTNGDFRAVFYCGPSDDGKDYWIDYINPISNIGAFGLMGETRYLWLLDTDGLLYYDKEILMLDSFTPTPKTIEDMWSLGQIDKIVKLQEQCDAPMCVDVNDNLWIFSSQKRKPEMLNIKVSSLINETKSFDRRSLVTKNAHRNFL